MSAGLCLCGCGGVTNIAKQDDARLLVRKGEHFRYIRGHQRSKGRRFVSSLGYVRVMCPGHPRAIRGYVHEHVLVVERALGRYLQSPAVVHHVNEVRSDNTPSNLVVLQSQSEHVELHARLRVLRSGGDPWRQRMCSCCGPCALTEFYKPKDRAFSSLCRKCSSAAVIRRRKESAA